MGIALKRVRGPWLIALLACGCANQPPAPGVPPAVNLSGFSAAFKQGYADGCESARSALAAKDAPATRRGGDYASGWNDGYSVCRRARR